MPLPTSALARARPHGIVLGISPSTTTVGAPLVELWYTTRSTATSSVSSQWAQRVLPRPTGDYFLHVQELPASTKTWYFRARTAAYQGVAAGDLTDKVHARPADLAGWQEGGRLQREAYRRNNTLYQGDAVIKPDVTNNDGTLNLPPIKGYLSGTANGGVATTSWADGAAVTFPQTYDAAPRVTLFPGAGTVFLERRATVWTSSGTYNTTGPQYVDLAAVNVTAAGFTPRARLIQRTTSLTARTANFGTSNALTAAGQATSATIANAPSVTDIYTVHYKWRMTYSHGGAGTTVSATLVMAADANATGAFVERATHTVVGTLSETTSSSGAHEDFNLTVTGLSSTEEIRLRVKSFTPSAGSTLYWGLVAHGFDSLGGDPHAGVTYYTNPTQNYAAMCPTTNDVITWVAQSVVAG